METETEMLNNSPIMDYPVDVHHRRGAFVIQPQKSQSNSKSHYSMSKLSITETENKTYDSDDSDDSDDDDEKFRRKHYRASKQVINMLKLKKADIDEPGGGAAMTYYNGNDIDTEDTETETETEVCDSSDDDNENEKILTDYRISYTTFHWIFIIFFVLITVIDRFTINLWPLWVDSPGPTIANNFSVSIFSLISWISGRMLIVSSSYLFLFQNNTFWNWFVELKCINKCLRIGDIHNENISLHYHIGWLFVGIPVLLHVWSVIFAGLTPPNSMKLYNSWMRPADPSTGNSIPFFNIETNLLSLGINDIYRIISTSITFLILIPYSIISHCRNSNWSLAQYIHLFGSLIYTIDLIRMYSHPHCWIFNVPFILWWILDRLYGIFIYRRCVVNIVKKLHLDSQYMILYLRIPKEMYQLKNIGDIFYFNKLDITFDRSHPFTVFYNHKYFNKMLYIQNEKNQLLPNWNGHKFQIYNFNGHANHESSHSKSQYIMSRKSTKGSHEISQILSFDQIFKYSNNEEENIPFENDWNMGIIVQIIPNHINCYKRKTWTNHVFQDDIRYLCGLRAFGPYRSEYRLLLNNKHKQPQTPLVLIGTGAGCSMLIDYYNYINNNDNVSLKYSVIFYFSTRSISLFQWFTDLTCYKDINNLFVNAHLTSHDNIIKKNKNYKVKKTRDSNIGRLNINQILNQKTNQNTNVYFCGSPEMQLIIANLCRKLSLTFHAGHSF